MKESIKGIRSVLYDLSVSSSEYAGTYRGVLEVFNNTSGSAANAQDAFNIVYNALKEAGVPLDELNKNWHRSFLPQLRRQKAVLILVLLRLRRQ